jgi:hypothetical protein
VGCVLGTDKRRLGSGRHLRYCQGVHNLGVAVDLCEARFLDGGLFIDAASGSEEDFNEGIPSDDTNTLGWVQAN